MVGSLYPVYPHDGDQVSFDLVQHPVRTDAQPTVGAADERAGRGWIVSLGFHGAVDGHHPGLVGHEADEGRLRDL